MTENRIRQPFGSAARGQAGAASPGEDRQQRSRFYAAATFTAEAQGYALRLDGRVVRTPGKRALWVPTARLAAALAAEWAAQGERLEPETMPLTKLANTVVDGVIGRETEVIADIVHYAGHDLVCYRAEGPEAFVQRQTALWDPVLAWAEEALGSRFAPAQGIMPVVQPEPALACVRSALASLGAFQLAALHVMTTLLGSPLLALAHAKGRLTVEEVWPAAQVDEDWQIGQWGEVPESAARRTRRRRELLSASRFLELSTA